MPQFGICTSPENSPAVRDAGWDFVEGHIQQLFQGLTPEAQWTGGARIGASALPVPSANSMVPGELKLTGPSVDFEKVRAYMTATITRAASCQTRVLVFGSGVARNIPEGFDRALARGQIIEFCRMSAEIAARQGVMIVVEPLNRGECNVINSVSEAMEYVRQVNHPNLQCLVDSYHFWLEDEPLANLEAAMPWIRHVHVADRDGRVAPGQSGTSDYRPFFAVLKRGGYDGRIAVEAGKFLDAPASYAGVLAYLKMQWADA